MLTPNLMLKYLSIYLANIKSLVTVSLCKVRPNERLINKCCSKTECGLHQCHHWKGYCGAMSQNL